MLLAERLVRDLVADCLRLFRCQDGLRDARSRLEQRLFVDGWRQDFLAARALDLAMSLLVTSRLICSGCSVHWIATDIGIVLPSYRCQLMVIGTASLHRALPSLRSRLVNAGRRVVFLHARCGWLRGKTRTGDTRCLG